MTASWISFYRAFWRERFRRLEALLNGGRRQRPGCLGAQPHPVRTTYHQSDRRFVIEAVVDILEETIEKALLRRDVLGKIEALIVRADTSRR